MSAALDVEAVRRKLAPAHFEFAQKTDSTMRMAAEGAAAEHPSGSVYFAEIQTNGVGRMGRRWHSDAGDSLAFSILLRPRLSPEQLPVLTLAVAVGVAEAIEEVTSASIDLRWPNDVLIKGLKCGGILLELQREAVIAGVGINVNQRKLPDPLKAIATSLALATGKEHNREDLLLATVRAVCDSSRMLETDGSPPILDLFTAHSSFVNGRRVSVEQEGQPIRGVTVGLDASGFLRLRTDEGAVITLVAGGLRPQEGR